MDYFDKKINELYNQPEQDIPSDLSWEFMEDGVYDRMDGKKSKRRAFWYWFTGGLVAVALVLLSTFIFTNRSISETDFTADNISITQDKTDGKIATNQEVEETKVDRTNAIEKESENKKVASKNNINAIKNAESKNSTIDNANDKIAINQEVKERDIISKSNVSNITEGQMTNNSIRTAILNDNEINNVDQISTTISNSNREKVFVYAITRKDLQPINIYSEEIRCAQPYIILEEDSELEEDERNTKYSLALSGGTTLHNGFGIGENPFTESLPGYSVRLGLEAESESGWGYQVGLNHSLLVESFDLDLIDTISGLHQDVIIRTLTNSVTGIVTSEYGDQYRNSIRHRDELSYSTINTLSLDASIYKRIKLGSKWSIAPSIGAQYDRLLNIEGRTLDATGEVFAYDNETTGINRNIFSAKLGLDVRYKLSPSWSLFTNVSQNYSINKLYDVGDRLSATNLQGGIAYRL